MNKKIDNINIAIYTLFSNFTSKSDFNQYHLHNIYFSKLTFKIKVFKHKSHYTKLAFDLNQFYKIMLIQNQFYKLKSKHTHMVMRDNIYQHNYKLFVNMQCSVSRPKLSSAPRILWDVLTFQLLEVNWEGPYENITSRKLDISIALNHFSRAEDYDA